MSPDHTTITRAEAVRLRREDEQKRRDKLTQKNMSKPKPVAAPKPATAHKPAARLQTERKPPAQSLPLVSTSRLQRRYDIGMSTPYGRTGNFNSPKVKNPASSFSMPHIEFGPRWVSLLISVFCAASLYMLFNMSLFIVSNVDIVGNNRVDVNEIVNNLGAMGQPTVLLNPTQIEYNILASFPDISNVQVAVNLPASITVTIIEREPITAWVKDGQVVWVDAQGFAFPPRGSIEGLTTVTANGDPPTPAELDVTQKIGARPFLTTDLSSAIVTLSPYVPQGAALVFDPKYGLGWSDPRGWKVYFGHSNGDTAMKLKVYQSMLDFLSAKSVQPSLISVEFPGAPFYRVEQ